MNSQPRFLQGTYPFEGKGLDNPAPLDGEVSYTVPASRRAQLVYFRGGNSSDEMISVALVRDGKPMRLFPIGAKGDTHVALRVVEDLQPESRLDVQVAAPESTTGHVVVDIGIVES